MRRPSTTNRRAGVALSAVVLLVAGCAAKGESDRLDPLGIFPPPPTITPAEAGAHVGELVVVRTRIGEARVEHGQAVLEPSGEGEGGLTIAIAPPIVGPSARELAAKYDGRDVRAIGTISDLGGDLELLIGDPSRIRLAEAESDAPGPPAGTATKRDVDAAPAPTPTPAPKAVTPVPAPPIVAPAPTPAAPTKTAADSAAEEACARARQAWRRAADDARAPLRELLTCLGEGEPRCRDAAARARIALAEVAASEERVRWVCGGGS